MGTRHDICVETVGVLAHCMTESGARVKRGETVLEIECMKVMFPYQAPADGVLHYTAELGETLGEGETIAYVEEDD